MARRGLGLAAAFALVVAAAPLVSTGAGAAPPDDVIPGAWIVTVAPGVSPDAVASDHGRRLGASVAHVYRHAARGYAAGMSDAAAARVAADPRVQSVVPDRRVRATAKPGSGGGGGQSTPTGVKRVGAVGQGPGVAVAVIDTGIDLDHPDLNVGEGVNCTTGTAADDGNGHGTHVAGTIGARDNGIGVVGVAPGTVLHPVRVLNNAGSGSWASIICGINWVTANAGRLGIGVANMSLGGSGSDLGCASGGMQQAVCDSVAAGVTYVVAAGNDARDAATFVPAAYDQVITVSALADFNGLTGGGGRATCRSDVDDTFANFSNYGTDIDLIAPGVCINSTWKGGGYKTISGTSMASPHVAGAAALYRAMHPSATPDDVRTGLRSLGGFDWRNDDDHDPIKEPLVRVDTL